MPFLSSLRYNHEGQNRFVSTQLPSLRNSEQFFDQGCKPLPSWTTLKKIQQKQRGKQERNEFSMDMQRTRNTEESEKLWSILYSPTHCKCCVIAIPNLDTWKWNPKRTQNQIVCVTDSSLSLQFQHLVGRLHIDNKRSFKRMVGWERPRK
jgi:hypothetical protein